MAPADINLGQTHCWLAQLHTTNLPPAPASSDSSTRSTGSADDDSSPTSSSASSTSGGGVDSNTSSPITTTTSPLTETRARCLQRLCEISGAHYDVGLMMMMPASSVNARFAPSNMNYIKREQGQAATGGNGQGVAAASPTRRRSSWSRRKSGQSLEELEGGSVRRFSLSRFKLR